MKSSNMYSVCKDDRERQGARNRRGKLPVGRTEAREDDASRRSGEEAETSQSFSLTGGGEGNRVGDRYCVRCRIVQGT